MIFFQITERAAEPCLQILVEEKLHIVPVGQPAVTVGRERQAVPYVLAREVRETPKHLVFGHARSQILEHVRDGDSQAAALIGFPPRFPGSMVINWRSLFGIEYGHIAGRSGVGRRVTSPDALTASKAGAIHHL